MRKRTIRKFKRSSIKNDLIDLTMNDMFEKFMLLKKGEGLARRTIDVYYANYNYFMNYAEKELSAAEMTTELFVGWIEHMTEEFDYSPHTVNIRVRTMRSFLKFAYDEKGWINEPIHKRFKPIKAPIDVIEAFTPEEIRKLIGAIDDSSYAGFRTKVIIFVLLDTMVRGFELVDIKRPNVNLKSKDI